MVNFNKQLSVVLRTGKVEFGSKRAKDLTKTGKTKMVILASNCPEPTKGKILNNAKISKVPVYTFPGTSLELASLSEKPFIVAAISIKEPGDSEILRLVEK